MNIYSYYQPFESIICCNYLTNKLILIKLIFTTSLRICRKYITNFYTGLRNHFKDLLNSSLDKIFLWSTFVEKSSEEDSNIKFPKNVLNGLNAMSPTIKAHRAKREWSPMPMTIFEYLSSTWNHTFAATTTFENIKNYLCLQLCSQELV